MTHMPPAVLAEYAAQHREATDTAAWPEGVIACYLTLAGATVALWEANKWSPLRAICSGCGRSSLDGGPDSSNPGLWAQAHAETCRAMPRPVGDR